MGTEYERVLAEIGPESPVVQEISDEYERYIDTFVGEGKMQSWEEYFVESVDVRRAYGFDDDELAPAQKLEWVVTTGTESGPDMGVAVDESELGLFMRSQYRIQQKLKVAEPDLFGESITLTFRLSTGADADLPGFAR
jgi:hypothetical protein